MRKVALQGGALPPRPLVRHVLPKTNRTDRNRVRSFDRARESREGFIPVMDAANKRAVLKHADARAASGHA